MKGAQKSKSDLLVEYLRKEDVLFRDQKRRAWATSTINGHKQHFLVEGEEYGLRISKSFLDQYECGIQTSELNSIVATLKALAIHRGEIKNTHLRAATRNGRIYFDLANEKNEMIEIDEQGFRIIPANDEIIFERYPLQAPQIYPVSSEKVSLGKYMNIKKSDELLFCVYVASLFIPEIQHPALVLYGESGQGKSTISKMIKKIADPCVNEVSIMERKVEDLFLTMEQNRVVAFDNISKISAELSDLFCAAITGVAQLKRRRYSDSNMYISKVNSCIVLNGIENVATRRDLLSRSLLFEVCGKKAVRPEDELLHEFEEDLPKILGYLFEVLSEALWIYPSVKSTGSFRMAEFEKRGYAIAEAMGGRGEEFLEAYHKNVRKQDAEAINSNMLILAIKQFLKENGGEICETPGKLIPKLMRVGYELGLNMSSDTMPKSDSSLTRKLNAHKRLLEKAGIEYSHEGHKNDGARIVLKKL